MYRQLLKTVEVPFVQHLFWRASNFSRSKLFMNWIYHLIVVGIVYSNYLNIFDCVASLNTPNVYSFTCISAATIRKKKKINKNRSRRRRPAPVITHTMLDLSISPCAKQI